MSNVDYKRVLGTTPTLSRFFERDPRDRPWCGLNIRLRVGARIADPNTSDDAAFDCAKDGEAAIRALTGAAAAERRRMIGKRKRCGAFAFAGSF